MSDPVRPSLRGRLLVATGALGDPNFRRTVVLIIEHDEGGALGVVLNRPSDVPVEHPLPTWGTRAAEPQVVFVGGPVEPAAVLGLGRGAAPPVLDGWTPVTSELGVVDLSRDPTLVGVDEVRVFAGYAGWAPEQLEAELAEGAWMIVDAHPADPFVARPDGLWPAVIRRQGGVYATFPDDPNLN